MFSADLLAIDLVLDDWVKTLHILAVRSMCAIFAIDASSIKINVSMERSTCLLETRTHMPRSRPKVVDKLIRMSNGAR